MGVTLTLGDISSSWQSQNMSSNWARLLQHLRQPIDYPDMGLPIGIEDVLLAGGPLDAMLALDAVVDLRDRTRLVWPSVLRAVPLTGDNRLLDVVDVTQRWVDGDSGADMTAVHRMAAEAASAAEAAARVEPGYYPAMAATQALAAATGGRASVAAARAAVALARSGARTPEHLLQVMDWCRLSPRISLEFNI